MLDDTIAMSTLAYLHDWKFDDTREKLPKGEYSVVSARQQEYIDNMVDYIENRLIIIDHFGDDHVARREFLRSENNLELAQWVNSRNKLKVNKMLGIVAGMFSISERQKNKTLVSQLHESIPPSVYSDVNDYRRMSLEQKISFTKHLHDVTKDYLSILRAYD